MAINFVIPPGTADRLELTLVDSGPLVEQMLQAIKQAFFGSSRSILTARVTPGPRRDARSDTDLDQLRKDTEAWQLLVVKQFTLNPIFPRSRRLHGQNAQLHGDIGCDEKGDVRSFEPWQWLVWQGDGTYMPLEPNP
jgi:hypothetical protein